jgi:hypothetical protein
MQGDEKVLDLHKFRNPDSVPLSLSPCVPLSTY